MCWTSITCAIYLVIECIITSLTEMPIFKLILNNCAPGNKDVELITSSYFIIDGSKASYIDT